MSDKVSEWIRTPPESDMQRFYEYLFFMLTRHGHKEWDDQCAAICDNMAANGFTVTWERREEEK